MYTFFTFGRLGVPFFMLLTGYLLFSRAYTYDQTIHFYKKNLLPLIITWEIWLLLYNIFLSYYNQSPFSFSTYIRNALFLQSLSLGHGWYIPMIIGTYIFLPIVSTALHSLPKKLIISVCAVLFLYEFLVPSSNWLLPFLNQPTIVTQLDLSFGGGQYGLYFILGYIFAKMSPSTCKKFQHRIFSFIIFVLFFLTVIIEMICVEGVWYNFFSLPIMSSLLFIRLKGIHLGNLLSFIQSLSLCSFGIYLLHYPLLMIFYRHLGTDCNPFIWSISLALITYCIAFLLVYAISKFFHCGQILFLKKY
ncbi:hypothetical protein SUBVAR_05365 [Subdoligranulum variabile DSM 15176]|uniref:Acyltransferase 3 domain-containing protein n=2 Tax=Subdoligranulum variabile TaxID=214851 RepID=D1PLI0_9FIRM|nr:hypothetical protein SUBVAR_05365 [Subdoligranulum variabile DSM 15176]